MKKTLILLSTFIFLFWGCENSTEIPPIEEINKAVIVVNEGGFGNGNSSISTYSIEDKTVQNNVYYTGNNLTSLGDTGNDIVIADDKGFVAVTGSNKIEVVTISDFKSVGIIDFTDFGGPRKIAISGNTGFATTANSMLVKFDVTSLSVLETLSLGFMPEGIVSANGKLFIAISGLDGAFGSGTTVTVVDESTFKVVKNITVKVNPINLVSDGNDVFVVSTGTYPYFGGDGIGMLTKIDASSLTIIDTLMIDKNPGKISLGDDKELYIINGEGIVHVSGSTMSTITSTLISGADVNSLYAAIYSVAYDADNDLLYLGNPKDYQQNGDVAIFNSSGVEEGRFDVGINPGTIVFKK